MLHVPIKADRSRRIVVEIMRTLREMMGCSLVPISTLEFVADALAKWMVQPIAHVESSKSLLQRMAKRSPLFSLSLPSAITKVWFSSTTSWITTKTSLVVVEHVVVPSNMTLLAVTSHGGDLTLEHVDVQRAMVGGGWEITTSRASICRR
jgi:hypothetical protein